MTQRQNGIILILVLAILLLCGGGLITLAIILRPASSSQEAILPSIASEHGTVTLTPQPLFSTPSQTLSKPSPFVSATAPKPLVTPTIIVEGTTTAAIKPIDLPANDLLFDLARQVIYASVPGRGGPTGNSVTPISVPDGAIGSPIPVGSEPNRMALSDDGQYLYVGLDGSATVRRVNLKTQKAEIEFALGSDFCGPLRAEDIAVVPGNSAAVVISKSNGKCSPRHAGVTLYIDGVARGNSTSGHTGSNVIQFESSSILYGYNNETTEFGLRTMTVSPAGVAVSATMQNLFSGFDHRIRLEDGLLYSTGGQVVDPKRMVLIGTYPVAGYVAPDSKAGRVYFLTLASLWGPLQIKIFDLRSFVLLASVDLEQIEGLPRGFTQVGPDQFAFQTTSGRVYLIRLIRTGTKSA